MGAEATLTRNKRLYSQRYGHCRYLDLVSAGVLQRTRRGAWLSQSLHVWINLLWTLTACQHLEKR